MNINNSSVLYTTNDYLKPYNSLKHGTTIYKRPNDHVLLWEPSKTIIIVGFFLCVQHSYAANHCARRSLSIIRSKYTHSQRFHLYYRSPYRLYARRSQCRLCEMNELFASEYALAEWAPKWERYFDLIQVPLHQNAFGFEERVSVSRHRHRHRQHNHQTTDYAKCKII